MPWIWKRIFTRSRGATEVFVSAPAPAPASAWRTRRFWVIKGAAATFDSVIPAASTLHTFVCWLCWTPQQQALSLSSCSRCSGLPPCTRLCDNSLGGITRFLSPQSRPRSRPHRDTGLTGSFQFRSAPELQKHRTPAGGGGGESFSYIPVLSRMHNTVQYITVCTCTVALLHYSSLVRTYGI